MKLKGYIACFHDGYIKLNMLGYPTNNITGFEMVKKITDATIFETVDDAQALVSAASKFIFIATHEGHGVYGFVARVLEQKNKPLTVLQVEHTVNCMCNTSHVILGCHCEDGVLWEVQSKHVLHNNYELLMAETTRELSEWSENLEQTLSEWADS